MQISLETQLSKFKPAASNHVSVSRDVAKRGLAHAWPCGKEVKALSLIQNLALTNEDQGENRYRLKQRLGLAAGWPQGNKSVDSSYHPKEYSVGTEYNPGSAT